MDIYEGTTDCNKEDMLQAEMCFVEGMGNRERKVSDPRLDSSLAGNYVAILWTLAVLFFLRGLHARRKDKEFLHVWQTQGFCVFLLCL